MYFHSLCLVLADFSFYFSNRQNSENEELETHERKRLKRLKAMSDSEEEDEEDDDRNVEVSSLGLFGPLDKLISF